MAERYYTKSLKKQRRESSEKLEKEREGQCAVVTHSQQQCIQNLFRNLSTQKKTSEKEQKKENKKT